MEIFTSTETIVHVDGVPCVAQATHNNFRCLPALGLKYDFREPINDQAKSLDIDYGIFARKHMSVDTCRL